MRRTFLSLGLALAGVLYPLVAAAQTWDVRAEDTIAGFGVEISVEGPASTELTVTITPPHGKDFTLTGETDNRGEALFELDPSDTEQAGFYEVTVGDARTTFEVFSGAPAVISFDTEDGKPMRLHEETILVAGIEDEFGNPVSGRPLLLLADRGEIQKIDEETGDDGTARFAFTSDRAGEVRFTVVDFLSEDTEQFTLDVGGGSGGLRASLLDEYEEGGEEEEEADYGFVDHFSIESENRSIGINDPFDIAIVALDRNDNRVEDYVGRVIVETTDPDGQVPRTPVKFYASDRGRVELPLSVTFGTPGSHTIQVSDESDRSIEGEEAFRVFGGNGPLEQGHIVISSPSSSATVGTGPVRIEGHAPAYINLVLYDNGVVKATTASDEEGAFLFTITLDAVATTHALYVEEGEGGLDRRSGTITLAIDTTIPKIENVTLLPEKVVAGGTTVLSVTAESQHSVRASIAGGEELSLSEGESSTGEGVSVYQVTLTAPEVPGNYPVQITVSDTAGNEAKETKSLTVEVGGLPPVTQLTATAFDRDIELSWTLVPGASAYRIYFGIHPTDFTNHIDTGTNAISARLTGLQGGQTYYFAVTGLSPDSRESIARSPIASATTRGSLFQLRLTPLVNSAGMEWVAPPSADVLAYRIQYGVESGTYTEQRLIGPSALRYQIPDLINGVTYYVTLGALLRDGELLLDSAPVAVTPGENGQPGIRLGNNDPLPDDIIVAPEEHDAAPPTTPRSGLPLSNLFILAFIGTGCFFSFRSFQRRQLLPLPSACPRANPRIQW